MSETVRIGAELDSIIEALGAGLAGSPEPVADGGVPDGDYDVTIRGIRPGMSRSGGAYLNIDSEIVGGADETIGGTLTDHRNLISEANFAIFKKTLRRLGIRTNEPQEVLVALGDLVGSTWSVTVANKNGFMNVYWNRKVR